MGEIRVNLTNAITVGLMAFAAIYAINKGLDYFGLSQYKAWNIMKMVNVVDFVKIGLMAYAFVWVANRTLDKVGLSQFRA